VGAGLDLDRHGDGTRERLTSEAVELDAGRVAFERRGDGPPLVLLHGAFGDSRLWRPQLDSLSGEFTVVAWDAPGCGDSFDPPPDYGLDGYADCLAAFIGALGLERPHVLGLSFGSGLALELFQRHPELARSLLLVSAYAGWAGSLGREVAEQRRESFLKALEVPMEEAVGDFSATLFTDSVPAEVVDAVVEVMLDSRPAGLRAMGNAFADADLRDVLPLVDVPTLLLYGDADMRSPVSVGEDLHARIPGSKFVVIPGPGHLVNVEAPERFDEEVRSFLAAPLSSSGGTGR
jgi:pimeloyl-ACP methyl ester carboxylesterase